MSRSWPSGYTHFDHADIYGDGLCEEIFGRVLKGVPGMRDKLLIGTKCGIRWKGDPDPSAPHRWDFFREHILRSCEGSLERLGTDRIDLYMLHRPDYLADPQEIAAAFSKLKQQGKVLEFGVSNFRPSLVSMIQKTCPMPLVVNQLDAKAGQYGVSRTVLSLAWLLKHPARIVPIVGSVNPARIRDAVQADDVTLSRKDWYSILVAARGSGLP